MASQLYVDRNLFEEGLMDRDLGIAQMPEGRILCIGSKQATEKGPFFYHARGKITREGHNKNGLIYEYEEIEQERKKEIEREINRDGYEFAENSVSIAYKMETVRQHPETLN